MRAKYKINFDVDLVVPFVDDSDPVWQKYFINYCRVNGDHHQVDNLHGARFSDLGLFNYNLQLINKFMPWLRHIYLIVSNIEQTKSLDLSNPKIKVVLHQDIIPRRFLPTFNSTTIEMFIAKIPDLAEHFIYINDDMYPIARLEKSDFFTADGKIKLNFTTETVQIRNNQFRKVCLNCFYHVADLVKYNYENNRFEYLRPLHSMTPMIKSNCLTVINKLKLIIYPYIEAFRTDRQHNQYIYPLYEYFTNNCTTSDISFIYTSLKHSSDEIIDYINSGEYQIICINDTRMSVNKRSELNITSLVEKFNELLKK